MDSESSTPLSAIVRAQVKTRMRMLDVIPGRVSDTLSKGETSLLMEVQNCLIAPWEHSYIIRYTKSIGKVAVARIKNTVQIGLNIYYIPREQCNSRFLTELFK